MISKKIFRAAILISVLLTGACASEKRTAAANTSTGNSAQSVSTVSDAMSVSQATSGQCANGGDVYTVYSDNNQNGVFDSADTVLSKQIVCNGVNGETGATGATGAQGPAGPSGAAAPPSSSSSPSSSQTPVEVITPCGATSAASAGGTSKPVVNKEVLLRLADGEVLGVVSDAASGLNTRLTVLADGSFTDTDSTLCSFTLATAIDAKTGAKTRSISWSGVVQESWTLFK